MNKQLIAAGLALAVAICPVAAQETNCPAGGTPQANAVRDACLQGVDVFQLIAPQLGLALAGGNATLGQGGSLGGLGHFTVGVRGNVFRGDLPQVTQFPTPRVAGGSGQQLPSKAQFVGLPVLDAAVGLFKGIPLPLTNILGVDLLVNAMYVPSIGSTGDNVEIRPQTNIKLGFGGRVGLVQESLLTPGIGVTYIVRDLPTTDIIGNSSSVTLNVNDASVKTSAWRVVANKNFIVFGLALGAGQDHYDESTNISGSVQGLPVVGGGSFNNVALTQKVTRTNVFGDLSFNIPLLKFIVEVGQVTGGTISLTNSFSSGKPDDSRLYGSLGLRFGL